MSQINTKNTQCLQLFVVIAFARRRCWC